MSLYRLRAALVTGCAGCELRDESYGVCVSEWGLDSRAQGRADELVIAGFR